MHIDPQLTDETVLTELGERLARLRLARDLTQRQLGAQAGVARTAIQRIEAGASVTTPNLIRVLRALDLLDALDHLVPESVSSPVADLKLRDRRRRRASGAHRHADDEAEQARSWRWGDES